MLTLFAGLGLLRSCSVRGTIHMITVHELNGSKSGNGGTKTRRESPFNSTTFYQRKRYRPKTRLPDLITSLFTVIGSTPDASDASDIRARAKEIGMVVMGQHEGHITPYETLVHDGPLKKAREGRDVAAGWVWKRLQSGKERRKLRNHCL